MQTPSQSEHIRVHTRPDLPLRVLTPRGDRQRIVEARRLVVEFPNGVCALREVDLDVARGEHVAIVGASGSGKTTLLRCLTKRVTPRSGDIDCQGRIATVHQDLRLVRQKTALQNVLHGSLGRHSFVRTLLGFPAAEKREAMTLLTQVGLGGRAHFPVSRLSGGERQRVAIARALMQRPCILLADEPVSSLDEHNAQHVMALLTSLCRDRNLALISVLHNPALAERYADRVVRLDEGRVIGAHNPGGCADPTHEACMGFCREKAATDTASPAAGSRDGGVRPPRMSVWQWGVVALLAMIAYAWAFTGLGISAEQIRDAGPGARSFLSALWPSSIEQITGLAWGDIWSGFVETIRMAIAGTTLGVLISAPLAVMTARNVGPRPLRAAVRMLLNIVRTIPSLIWALFFVAMLGFGAFAGVAALAMYSTGYLTKFFYEAFEAVDAGPQEALEEIGAGGLHRFAHAVFPASLPIAASSCLFMLEYNVRGASVLGIVGAGGIGAHIMHFLDYRNFPAAIACLAMVLVVVIALDAVSTRVRAWAVGR